MKPPIPVPDPYAEALVFRCKFLHPWIVITFGSLIFGLLPLIGSLPTSGDPKRIVHTITFATGIAMVSSGLYTILMVNLLPLKLTSLLLRGQNVWSKAVQAEWTQISAVQRTNFATLPYLKISTPHKKNIIWLPLFLADPHGLCEAVASFTPPDHPLRLALEKEFQE